MTRTWFANLIRRRKTEPSSLPLGLTPDDIDALRALRDTPHWKHYLVVLERLGEQHAAELASGLPYDKYLFTSGAFTALRRVFTLADDLIVAASTLKEHTNVRERKLADRNARHAAAFVNTPWYESWRAERA